jgi:hypothetical protein
MEPVGMSIADRHEPAPPVTRGGDHTASAAHAVMDKASDPMRPTGIAAGWLIRPR